MEQKVIIRVKDIGKQLFLTGKVSYEGRDYYITKSGKYFADKLPDTEEIYTRTFTLTDYTYTIKWDDTPHPDEAQAAKGRLLRVMDENYRMIATLWKYHKQIMVYGEPEMINNKPNPAFVGKKTPLFVYEHLNKRNTNKLSELKRKNKVVNKILDMQESNKEELVNVAYYFLPSVASKKNSDIVIALIDERNGYLLNEPNMSNFLEMYKSADPHVIMITYIKKAIALKFIEDKGKEGYFINTQYAGSNFNAVADYLKNNENLYEAIQKDVRKSRELIEDDVMTPKKLDEKNDSSLIEAQNELADLRARAKGLSIRGYQNMYAETLRERIKEVEDLEATLTEK